MTAGLDGTDRYGRAGAGSASYAHLMDKGDAVADFELPDQTGTPRRLSQLLEDRRQDAIGISDDGRGQLAVGNAISTILVILPFDQCKTVLGFRPLDRVVQRWRQGLFEVLRDKAIALGLVTIIKTVRYGLEFFDEIEAEIQGELKQLEDERKLAKPSPFYLRMKAAGKL